MSNKDITEDYRNLSEEQYIRKQEEETRDRLRRETELKTQREEMGRIIGISDDELLVALQKQEYTAETVKLVELLPLVKVAWGDGSVSGREKEELLKALEFKGIKSDSAVGKQIDKWLIESPSDSFFQTNLELLAKIFEKLPETERAARRENLLIYCNQIANASGSFLGVGSKVSEGEQKAIDLISSTLPK